MNFVTPLQSLCKGWSGLVSSAPLVFQEVRCVAFPEQKWLERFPHLRVSPVLAEDVRRIDLAPDVLEVHRVQRRLPPWSCGAPVHGVSSSAVSGEQLR